MNSEATLKKITYYSTYVKTATCVNTGGGCMVDLLTLEDGRVIGINDEYICLYTDEDQFWNPVSAHDIPTIELSDTTPPQGNVHLKAEDFLTSESWLKMVAANMAKDKYLVLKSLIADAYMMAGPEWAIKIDDLDAYGGDLTEYSFRLITLELENDTMEDLNLPPAVYRIIAV